MHMAHPNDPIFVHFEMHFSLQKSRTCALVCTCVLICVSTILLLEKFSKGGVLPRCILPHVQGTVNFKFALFLKKCAKCQFIFLKF